MEGQELNSKLRALLDHAGPPELGPGPRPGILSIPELNKAMQSIPEISGAKDGHSLVRSLLYLWHDHLDASHEISQEHSSDDGSYVHGIMHRREPDYGNAKYWFRRVEDHDAFIELSERVALLLGGAGGVGRALSQELRPSRGWDAFAFVDLCQRLEGKPADDPEVMLALEIQAVEFENLILYFSS